MLTITTFLSPTVLLLRLFSIQDEDQAFRKMLLRCEDVQGKNVLTQFYGMDFTTDKIRSLVRKWFSLIECYVDVKTTDLYTLRIFCIGFTKRRMDQAGGVLRTSTRPTLNPLLRVTV